MKKKYCFMLLSISGLWIVYLVTDHAHIGSLSAMSAAQVRRPVEAAVKARPITQASNPGYAWHTFYGGSGHDTRAKRLAIDGSRNIYITGYSTANWLGANNANPLHPFTGLCNLFVLKLDGNGQYQWHTFYGTGSGTGDYGNDIAVDAQGNVYVTGSSAAAWTGDNNADPIHPFGKTGNLFALKLNNSGAYQWHTFYGPQQTNSSFAVAEGNGIAWDESGAVYITGRSDGSWLGDNSTAPLRCLGDCLTIDTAIVVIKLSVQGAYQWHTFYGSSSGHTLGSGLAIAVNGGGVYVTGTANRFLVSAVACPGPGCPIHDCWPIDCTMTVLKLNVAGNYQWHTFYQGDSGTGIAADSTGISVVGGGGTWKGDGNRAPLHTASDTSRASFSVLKLDQFGAYQWHTFYGPGKAEGVALGEQGRIYVTGESSVTWLGDTDAAPLHAFPGGYYDLFALKLGSSGNYEWHTFYGAASKSYLTYGNGIAVDKEGKTIQITGYTDSTWLGDNNVSPLHAFSVGQDLFAIRMTATPALPTSKVFLPVISR